MTREVNVAYRMRLGADDLLHCRFALSPLLETQECVRLLAHPAYRARYHLPWLRYSAASVRRLGLDLLWMLMPEHGYCPDFLTPPPVAPAATFEQEVARVRATDPAQARREIQRSLADTPGTSKSPRGQALMDDPASAIEDLAQAIHRAWEALVAPHWPRLRTLLEADIAHHIRMVADVGLAGLFSELHPQVSWQHDTLTIHGSPTDERTLTGEGVLLVPSFFAWPDVVCGVGSPWSPLLAYPARGIGQLWEDVRPDPSTALARLLGTNRATVLTALDRPICTTVLARKLGLAPSSVSAHLTALREAGLLVSHRERHQVLYERTPLGSALIDGYTGQQ